MIVDDFERMIENNKQSFTDDVYGLFFDSVKCFRASIYRPSYLLAYQGVMQHFRHLLQTSKKPDKYDEGKWKGVLTRLQNDKTFDEEVFDCTQHKNQPSSTPPVIAELDIPDPIREDFRFWRNRRNDCAHYKEYDINNSQVLAFYSFINQYLLKISVEGGKNSLLREFCNACDEKKTSPNKSLQPLIDKIVPMVAEEQIDDFFEELYHVMGGYHFYDSRFFRLLYDILSSSNQKLKDYAIRFLGKSSYLSDYLTSYPDSVGLLVSKEESHHFWMVTLANNRCRCAILSNMLKSGLIESVETEEAITKIIEHCYVNNQGIGEIEDSDWDNLVRFGFLDVLKSKYFNPDFTSNNARTLGKEKYNFFYGYIFKLMKKKEWVGIIISIFSRPDYPTVWRNIFVENYLSSSENKAYFEEVCKEYALDIPECLK
ncbi:MAG: hypothetical protein MJZ20_09625 [Bacteroidaceae bacterium]|nr:hypothetical protein [Bacteroidaceae bacterium]